MLLIATHGCAQSQPTRTGFLSDYSGLETDPIHLNYGIGTQRAQTRHASSQDYRSIDSIYIEPTRWLVDPESRAGQNSDYRETLLSKLDEELRDQLGQVRPIVDTPGPGTARVRSAITTVQLSRPLANLALTATFFSPVPIGPIFTGGAAIEAEVIGPDGRQISAVSSASGGGLIDLRGFYSRSGHARKAIRRNVRELKESLMD